MRSRLLECEAELEKRKESELIKWNKKFVVKIDPLWIFHSMINNFKNSLASSTVFSGYCSCHCNSCSKAGANQGPAGFPIIAETSLP